MNAIEVRNLSKKFVYYPSQRDRLFDMVSGGRTKKGNDFWALKDISFEVPKGTTFGIIGQNGSGKSTLLSILAGVLRPTSGSYTVNGKVAAILELGSGFHHEFTGRENVYMYGAILGLSRAEIGSRFDDIIDFSELHEFIDRPLYTYSSGMVVRLAFSVAVNVDADILIIDEALAVGDALFQHRCFLKIQALQAAGKSILYVGHDIETLRSICNAALLLDGGKIIRQGHTANDVVNFYAALIKEREQQYREKSASPKKNIYNGAFIADNEHHAKKRGIRFGTKDVEIQNIEMLGNGLQPKNNFQSGENVHIRISLRSNKDIESGLNIGFVVRSNYGEVYGINTHWLKVDVTPKRCGDTFEVEFVQKLNLGAGMYTLSPIVAYKYSADDEAPLDWLNDWFTFTIQSNDIFLGCANLQSSVSVSGQTMPQIMNTDELATCHRNVLSLYGASGIAARILEQWSIPVSDYEILANGIHEKKPAKILEIGTFVGVSTFLMSALLDDTQHIYSIDPNLLLIDEIEAVDGAQELLPRSIRTQDIARAVKNRHFAEKNIDFLEGCLNYDSSYSQVGGIRKLLPDLLDQKVTFDFIFIDGLHFTDAVLSDLCASVKILAKEGVIFLHDGRGRWAEEVLFGVCKFIEKHQHYELTRFPDSSIVKLRNTYE
ncbi:Wzt carbohydrate-binding domain-containing protein [Candidatus Uhrbacteria bacterium]|nr:Wzt carbohydrate-binding domain-containing protein [Candidatus Uhrbacteria bacterium]